MSVIGNQCDELRDRAGTLRTFAESIGDEAVRNTMVIAAEEMFEAADTIWELRCKMEDMVDQRDEIKRLRAEIWEQKQTIGRQRRENMDWEEQYHSLAVENIRMRQLVARMYRDMQGVLDRSTDTVFVDRMTTLRDCMDVYMECMAELGMPPCDYESRRRELGIEVE